MALPFYGPHPCDRCGATVVRAAREQGGTRYDLPEGQIYPNTVWAVHECDPAAMERAPRAFPGGSAFGNLMRERREEQGRSLRDLEAQTGVSAATISRIENGADAMVSNVAALANALGVTTPLFAVDLVAE